MANSFVANKVTVSIVCVTFGDSLIDSAQVQVDSIILCTGSRLSINR